MISIVPLTGIPKIKHGDDLAGMIADAAHEHFPFNDQDCIVVASKVVSKAQGRVVTLTDGTTKSDLVKEESARILRTRGDLIISETEHGFVCANAGIDESNTESGTVVLLPHDIDAAAHKIRMKIQSRTNFDVAVIISDTFGRPFRMGETNVALGYSGLKSFADLTGSGDLYDRELKSTSIALADEIAGAAELVMHKNSGVCAALVRGLPSSYRGDGRAKDLVRSPQSDLFR
jgi:coenzyme F420-0:L-glutamate ligase/coenzyme F420-1:gamma-L-glutamate ligase